MIDFNALIQKGMQQRSNDPRFTKAVSLYLNHDTEGLRQMAENLCKEYNTDPETVKKSIQQSFGMT